MASDRQIWPYVFFELVNLSKMILFHILVDPIRGLDPEIEKRKNNFSIFSTLTNFLTVYFTLLYKGFLETTVWPARQFFFQKISIDV